MTSSTRKTNLYYEQVQAQQTKASGSSSRSSSQSDSGVSERVGENQSGVVRASVNRANIGAVISFSIPIVSRYPSSGGGC